MTIPKDEWDRMMNLYALGTPKKGEEWNQVPYVMFSKLMEELLLEKSRPKVGVAMIVRKGSAVLVGRRKGGRGHGTWALPGGHLEYRETVESCVIREMQEETGLAVTNIRSGPYVNNYDFAEDQSHYVTLFVTAELVDWGAVPRVMEPEKCYEWRWCFKYEDHEKGRCTVPEPRFPPLQKYMEKYDLFLSHAHD